MGRASQKAKKKGHIVTRTGTKGASSLTNLTTRISSPLFDKVSSYPVAVVPVITILLVVFYKSLVIRSSMAEFC